MERAQEAEGMIAQRGSDGFARCVAFLTGFAERRAARVTQSAYGRAVFDDELPRAWDLNALWVWEALHRTADELVAEVDRLQGAAGLAHRKLTVVTCDAIDLTPRFVALGWEATTMLVMPQLSIQPRAAGESEVVELRPADVEPFWVEGISRAPWADAETVRQLVAAQHARRRAALVRYFGVLIDGQIASTCELFSHESVAQVESVMTVEHHRGRGLATAVVSHAATQARAGGAALVFLLADEAEGSQRLYRKLGFDAVGRIAEFTLPPAVAGSNPAPATV